MNMMRGGPPAPDPIGAAPGRGASPPAGKPSPDGDDSRSGTQDGQADRVLPAILLVVASVALFSVSDVLAKLLRQQSLPATEIAWLRYLAFAGLAVLLAGRGRFAGLRPRRPGLQVLRGLFLLGSALFFITGLAYLPVAEATAIVFISPTFITALSVVFLGEVVGIRRWAAVLAGFLGVLVVIRPGGDSIQAAALLPVASALSWAATIVITRKIGTTERAETTLLWSACIGLLALTAVVPFGFLPPSPGQVGIGLALGLCSSLGQYLVILAYRRAAASVLAPFSYVQLLSSALLGYAAFSAVPDQATLLGAAVIVLSGLYTAHRERIRARERLGKRLARR
jgi:drug/metabolite transporter (DMT)-like permease